MVAHFFKGSAFLLLMVAYLACEGSVAQELDASRLPAGPAHVPDGVEVLARGPVHEAYAAPTVEPKPTPVVPRQPPAPLEEMPPDERPQGDSVWISGYWAWDDERTDFLWVSGCWRTPPPGKEWMSGYWRELGGQWQWVAGFWTSAAKADTQAREIAYYPEPPPPPAVAPPGAPPNAETFHVPGHWVWQGDRYAWQAGFWARFQPGYVWVPAHYRWTPFGHVFVAGYWDLAVTRRGILYAPVTVNLVAVGPQFVFTPTYAVCDAILFDAFFVRPACCHYYFGDYYGPAYRGLGYESCLAYSRRSYDAVVVCQRWEQRNNPSWLTVQLNLFSARDAGHAPRPPRTLVQQNNNVRITNVTNVTNVYNTQVIAPTKVVAASRGQSTVPVDAAARTQAKQTARHAQQTAIQQRQQTETATAGATLHKPRVASMKTPIHHDTPHGSTDTTDRKMHPDHKPPAPTAGKTVTEHSASGPAKEQHGKGPASAVRKSAGPATNTATGSAHEQHPKGPASTAPNPAVPAAETATGLANEQHGKGPAITAPKPAVPVAETATGPAKEQHGKGPAITAPKLTAPAAKTATALGKEQHGKGPALAPHPGGGSTPAHPLVSPRPVVPAKGPATPPKKSNGDKKSPPGR